MYINLLARNEEAGSRGKQSRMSAELHDIDANGSGIECWANNSNESIDAEPGMFRRVRLQLDRAEINRIVQVAAAAGLIDPCSVLGAEFAIVVRRALPMLQPQEEKPETAGPGAA